VCRPTEVLTGGPHRTCQHHNRALSSGWERLCVASQLVFIDQHITLSMVRAQENHQTSRIVPFDNMIMNRL